MTFIVFTPVISSCLRHCQRFMSNANMSTCMHLHTIIDLLLIILLVHWSRSLIDWVYSCDSYAIGGLAGGESKDSFWRVVAQCTAALPEDKPRYVMVQISFIISIYILWTSGVFVNWVVLFIFSTSQYFLLSFRVWVIHWTL